MKLFLAGGWGNGREGRDGGEEGGEYEKSAFFFFSCHSDKTFAFLEEMRLLPPLGACTRRFICDFLLGFF